jgi:selenocysteine lyase/cysteine desulfurase
VSGAPGTREASQPLVGEAVRGRFPIFEHTTYVNACSQGALSIDVRRAYEAYLDGWDEHGAAWEHWVERAEAARAAFAGLVGAAADEVAVVTSVTQAVNSVVSSLPLDGERNRIVISEFEFPTVGQIAHAQELRGAEVVHVRPEPDGTIPPERFAEAIDERTALVCCTTVSYRTGFRLDVGEVARLAHERGALVFADSYQAAGSVPLDVRALGVDFLAAGTVKYLLASAGLAFLYARGPLVGELRPTQTGWFADEDIFEMQIARYRPHATARRFDSGTPPVPNIYAGIAGIALVARAGVPEIAAHVRGLNERLLAGLDELGATVVTPLTSYGALVCVLSTDPNALVAALAEDRIVTSSRDRNLRISLHLYNVEEDVDRVLASLARHRALLA